MRDPPYNHGKWKMPFALISASGEIPPDEEGAPLADSISGACFLAKTKYAPNNYARKVTDIRGEYRI